MELKKAVVVITGGSGGLGRAIAEAYVTRGANVALVDVQKGPLSDAVSNLQHIRRETMGIQADVTNPDDVEAMVKQVTNELGPIDILVNSAGTLGAIGPVWEVDPEKWLKDVMVSLYGSFVCCHYVVKRMIERRRGYVLNMFGGGKDPQPYMTGYVSAKAGLLLMTEGLAKEVRAYGVKVFALRPGIVRTSLHDHLLSSSEGKQWRPDFRQIFNEGGDVSPDLVVKLAVQLVGGKADALSGRLFDAQQDFDEVVNNADEILENDLYTLRLRG